MDRECSPIAGIPRVVFVLPGVGFALDPVLVGRRHLVMTFIDLPAFPDVLDAAPRSPEQRVRPSHLGVTESELRAGVRVVVVRDFEPRSVATAEFAERAQVVVGVEDDRLSWPDVDALSIVASRTTMRLLVKFLTCPLTPSSCQAPWYVLFSR